MKTPKDHTSELREADKKAINKICDVFSMDEALAIFDERVAAHVHDEVVRATGWTMELPKLPYFQVTAFDEKTAKAWVSPIYDTKSLPVQLKGGDKPCG
jgi:hypothetical protein